MDVSVGAGASRRGKLKANCGACRGARQFVLSRRGTGVRRQKEALMVSPFQFSVRQLLAAIAFVAVGAAALRNANDYWMSGIWAFVSLLLAVVILLVIFRRGQSQAFWIGFALFGWLYFAIVLVAYWPTGPNVGRSDPLVSYQLATTRLIDWTYTKIIPDQQRQSQIPNPAAQGGGAGGMSGGMMGMGSAGGMPMGGSMGPGGPMSGFGGMPGMGSFVSATIANPDYIDASAFQQIGHALWLVALAALGGKVAQWIHRTGVRNQESADHGRT